MPITYSTAPVVEDGGWGEDRTSPQEAGRMEIYRTRKKAEKVNNKEQVCVFMRVRKGEEL